MPATFIREEGGGSSPPHRGTFVRTSVLEIVLMAVVEGRWPTSRPTEVLVLRFQKEWPKFYEKMTDANGTKLQNTPRHWKETFCMRLDVKSHFEKKKTCILYTRPNLNALSDETKML